MQHDIKNGALTFHATEIMYMLPLQISRRNKNSFLQSLLHVEMHCKARYDTDRFMRHRIKRADYSNGAQPDTAFALLEHVF